MYCISSNEQTRKKKPFTLQEDQDLINLYQQTSSQSLNSFCKMAADKMKRSKESVRDRLRRYLLKITPEERGLIKVMSVSKDKQFLVFGENQFGEKIIQKLTQKKIKEKCNKENINQLQMCKKDESLSDIQWLQQQTSSKDEAFANRILAYFTETLINFLLESGKVKLLSLDFIVNNLKEQFTLSELLDQVYPLDFKREGI